MVIDLEDEILRGLTRRQSQRPYLSRRMLTHSSRQAGPWLIFDVRQKNKAYATRARQSLVCGEDVWVGRVFTDPDSYSAHPRALEEQRSTPQSRMRMLNGIGSF